MFDIGVWCVDAHELLQEVLDGDKLCGMAKLLQRVCIALLQERDTAKYSFGRPVLPGCYFMTALRNGEIRTEMDVSAQFFLARHFIFEQLRREETPGDPPDECFKDVRCQGVRIEPGVLKLKLSVQSCTAERTVWLPIKMPY